MHFWADPNPTPSSPPGYFDLLYDYASCFELYREFFAGLARVAGNTPNIRDGGSEFDLSSPDVRYGRKLVASFELGTDLSDEPWIVIPYSSVQIPGSTVQISATVIGGSTIAGTFTAPAT